MTTQGIKSFEPFEPFEPTHWGTQQATVRDPDGRLWSLQAPAAP